MHALLLMAAAHLRYLHSGSRLYLGQESQHFSSTIIGFQNALTSPSLKEGADAVTACSLLLLQYSWSVPYPSTADLKNATCSRLELGNMLGFSAGLKTVLQTAWQVRTKSVFNTIIHAGMLDKLKAWVNEESVPCTIEELLSSKSMLPWPYFDHEDSGCAGYDCDLRDAVDRLIPLLRAATSNRREVDFLKEANQYLVLWPGKCDGIFRRAVERKNQEALLIMLCFFLCTATLASKEFWWLRDRSAAMAVDIHIYLDAWHPECRERVAQISQSFQSW